MAVSTIKQIPIMEFNKGNVTSNSSGMVNISADLGVPITARCVIAESLTNNIKVSTPIFWNGSFFVVVNDYNSGSPKANASLSLQVAWVL